MFQAIQSALVQRFGSVRGMTTIITAFELAATKAKKGIFDTSRGTKECIKDAAQCMAI